jgi:hypothetical protein
MMENTMKKVPVYRTVVFVVFFGLIVLCGCDLTKDKPIVSSRAYSGHESDKDMNNFVSVYPEMVGKRLDDCQTCHRAGVSGTATSKVYNPCSYCHLLVWQDPVTYPPTDPGVPKSFVDTLNSYGLAYLNAGETKDAIKDIRNADSDSDGYTNDEEIADLRYPGDALSNPSLPLAPVKTVSLNDTQAMSKHSQFLLMNTSKQQFDDYTKYEGVKVTDFFAHLGIDLAGLGATGITIFAPDGFSTDFDLTNTIGSKRYYITGQYPQGTFHYVTGFSNPKLEFINIPSTLPAGVSHLQPIPDELYLLIAYNRDGKPLSSSYYDGISGRLEGEGPFRIVPPQKKPSSPDRGNGQLQAVDASDLPAYNYNSGYDHNAGSSVRGMCVIRINPMPAGIEEYDWKAGGWSLIADKEIVIYGLGIN